MSLAQMRHLTYRAHAVLVIAACSVVISACGDAVATSSVGHATNAGRAERSAGVPSAATRMVCGPEGQQEIARAIGATPVRPVTPTWRSHHYSCDYVYRTGTLALGVEQSTAAENARTYYAQLTRQAAQKLTGLGTSAAALPDGTVIVRKDNDILTVDARGLPSRFGQPPDSRNNIALTVAATIMGCWTES